MKDKLDILLRLKDVLLMMILFNFFPSHIYKFSTRKFLPNKSNRFFAPKKIEPYKIIKKKTNMNVLGEVNLVTIGRSFNINKLKKLKGKIFFVPGWEPLKKDKNGNIFFFRPGWEYNDKKSQPVFRNLKSQNSKKKFKGQLTEYKNKSLTYCIGRQKVLDKFLNKGYNFLCVSTYHKIGNKIVPTGKYWESKEFKNLFKKKNLKRVAVLENFHKPSFSKNEDTLSATGSVIPYLYTLAKFSKKVNVYGWDFYLDKSPKKMGYWEIFSNLYKYKIDVYRSKNHFESALMNFYYAYQFSKLPNVKINSYLGDLEKHKKLIKKIEQVFFNY